MPPPNLVRHAHLPQPLLPLILHLISWVKAASFVSDSSLGDGYRAVFWSRTSPLWMGWDIILRFNSPLLSLTYHLRLTLWYHLLLPFPRSGSTIFSLHTYPSVIPKGCIGMFFLPTLHNIDWHQYARNDCTKSTLGVNQPPSCNRGYPWKGLGKYIFPCILDRTHHFNLQIHHSPKTVFKVFLIGVDGKDLLQGI